MERFFLNLKMERVWQRDYVNHDEARRDIARLHRELLQWEQITLEIGYLSPAVFERKMAAIPPISVSEIT